MNIKRKIFIGSRRSKLARKQAELVAKKIFKLGIKNLEFKYVVSLGDKVSHKEFKSQGGKGLFTKEIDKLLIKNEIDIAIHSAKDIPARLDERLIIAAYLPREDVRDVLVTKDFKLNTLLDCNETIIFGSSSPRRINYLKSLFPLLRVKNLRGNVESRIQKVRDNKIDATLLAISGIKRINLKYDDINFIKISSKIILPAPGQGAIAILCRKNNNYVKSFLEKIDHYETRVALLAERSFIKEINGDCFTPLAALAKVKNNKIVINARLYNTSGNSFSEAKVVDNVSSAEKAGKLCAKKVLESLKKNG